MQTLLFRILGKRAALLFGSICFLSVSVLGALYMTAGYSLEAYVSNQMSRLPWDAVTLQNGSTVPHERLRNDFQELEFVQKSEVMGIVRVQQGNGIVGINVDGEPIPLRWIMLIATSDPSLLPQVLKKNKSPVVGEQDGSGDEHGLDGVDHNQELHVSAALLTASNPPAGIERIRAGSKIRIYQLEEDLRRGHYHGSFYHTHEFDTLDHDHDGGDDGDHKANIFLSATVAAPPTQLKRIEINNMMLAKTGALSYLPENSLIISVPMNTYERIVPELNKLFVNLYGTHDGSSAAPYLPELIHLIDFDNSSFLSSWELGSSKRNLSAQLSTISTLARDANFNSYISSDAYQVLTRMANISRMVGMVTLLIAIPLIWLVWVVSQSLSGLFLTNERRLIGLVLVRGVSLQAVSSSLRSGLILGGLAGGILGLIVGLGIPVLGNTLAGRPAPPLSVFQHGLVYFLSFLGIGLVVSLIAGRGVIRRIQQMTPLESMTRITGDEGDEEYERPSATYVAMAFMALFLGGYKVCAWIAGRSLLFPFLHGKVSESILQYVMLGESLLNFLAVPLFLYGVTGVLRLRSIWLQHVFRVLSIPLVGRLHWFVAKHVTLGWRRTTSTVFLTSLAMSLALLPQVAADSFYDRVLRGVDASVGGDIQLMYDFTELAGGKGDSTSVMVYDDLVRDRLLSIQAVLKDKPRVLSVAELQEYIVPGFYLPGRSTLSLNLLRETDDYLKTVSYEEQLGLTRPFSNVVQSLSGEFLASSSGFLNIREIPLESDIVFGYSSDYTPIIAQIKDVVSYFPGQPAISVSEREGYAAAETDYLNYVMKSDARLFSTISHFTKSSLADLRVIPSRAVILVQMEGDIDDATINELANVLPIKPNAIRWRGEERRNVNKDMFISLTLGNMQVFMIGGLILAVAGVFAVSLASFRAEKRTLSLLRLRGVPPSQLMWISLSMFLVPVLIGAALGVLLGAVSGYGVSQAIWELPRIYGVAGALENQLVFSLSAWCVIVGFGFVLSCIAVGFGLWSFRHTARDAIRER